MSEPFGSALLALVGALVGVAGKMISDVISARKELRLRLAQADDHELTEEGRERQRLFAEWRRQLEHVHLERSRLAEENASLRKRAMDLDDLIAEFRRAQIRDATQIARLEQQTDELQRAITKLRSDNMRQRRRIDQVTESMDLPNRRSDPPPTDSSDRGTEDVTNPGRPSSLGRDRGSRESG